MSQPPAKRRRVELTLKDKIKLITESTAQPKPSLKALGDAYSWQTGTLWKPDDHAGPETVRFTESLLYLTQLYARSLNRSVLVV
ncbi:hypothetical protein DPMN_093234 [Dreissena polymorpha]|uniref:Uncharacterized protein n=1 Tax=Dreissena polymorpha TaxID=45954 RepID=A0A9D4L354_DREPO|nr:hypothetical protein DPMN_093234 [Dreissena polymorpha]